MTKELDEKFDKAEKVIDRTQKLILKIVGGLVAIGLAIFVGLEQLGGEEPIEEDETGESLIENKDNSEPTTEKIEPEQPEINQSQQLQQELAQDKKQLKQ